jgi:PAS domain S-box-containing protein
MSVNERADIRSGYAFILIFAIMAVGIAMTGYINYQNYERNFRAEVEGELSGIAKLKVGELVLWRNERLGDGAVLFKNAAFSALVRRYLEKPEDTDAHRKLQEWMGKYTTAYQYARVALYDTQGIRRMSAPEAPPGLVDSTIPRNVTAILREGRVFLQDFHRYTPETLIHLSVVVPIFDEPDYSRPLGVLALRIDPTTHLYPFIARWPTPTKTAETLLVRRDGNDALFLNANRFNKNSALNLRIPLTKTEVPAVKAVLGQTGVEEGVDYGGKQVVAKVSAIPDSPWRMVSKIETSELYAPVREQLWQIVTFASVMLVVAAMSMVLIWRQRDARYREQDKAAEALVKSEKKYRQLIEGLQEGVWVIDKDSLTTFVNPPMARMLGYTVEEMLGRLVFSFMDERGKTIATQNIERRKQGIKEQLDFELLRKDGIRVYTALSSSPVMDEDGNYAGAIAGVMDITGRKQAEEKLRRSENLMAKAQRVARIGHWEWDIRNDIVTWSDEMFRVLGYEPGAITPSMDAFMDSVLPEERARVNRIIGQSITGGGSYVVDRVSVLPDGTKRIVHAEGTVEFDESGAPRRMFAVVQDVTDSKLMQERLQTQQVELKIQNEELLQTQEDLEAARAKYFDLYNLAPVGYFTIS